MKFIMFGIVLVSAIAILSTVFASGANNDPQSLSQEEFVTFSEQADVVVIDVRTAEEYAKGHVPGAINLPHRSVVSGELTIDDYSDKNVVLYCHGGGRADIVKNYLNENLALPQEKLFHLRGDFQAWQAKGRTIVKP